MTDFFYKKCEVVRDLLPIYADHGTSPETTALVAQHIAKCDCCSKYLCYIRKRNEKKRAEIKAEITPDYLNFLKALKRKRQMGNALMLSAVIVCATALSTAMSKLGSGK